VKKLESSPSPLRGPVIAKKTRVNLAIDKILQDLKHHQQKALGKRIFRLESSKENRKKP
jgi:hypothetical protein